jgi:hypothetical protein
MIHLEKGQAVPENENLEVTNTGDYAPDDFVLCNNKGEEDPIVQFQANFFVTE